MWTAFQVFLFTVAAPLIRHILKALGIGAVTYTGLTIAIDQLESMFLSSINGLAADVVGILGIMQIDVAFNMIVSSVIAKAILDGLNSTTGSKKSYTLKA